MDCIGLIWVVWNDLGLPPVEIPSNYTQTPQESLLVEHANKHLVATEKTFDTMQPGDVMIMWGWTRHEAQHFGIVGEHGGRKTMVHAWSKHGQVVEHPVDDFWRKRLVKVYEYPDTEVYGG